MIRPLLPIVLALAVASPARAQMIVHDPASYTKLISQAQTAVDQLRELKTQVAEARRLYDGFNTPSGARSLAPTLHAPELRAVLPDLDGYLAAAQGDLAALGRIGARAAELRASQRLFTPPADDGLGQEIERQGDRAARDAALGQAAAEAGARRLVGLEQLAAALDAAATPRAVLDLQARLAAEQAMIANDQMRLQGLAMAQAAEDRLQAQRDRERAAAAAAARLRVYRAGFP